jgi:hypothetical protein
VAITFLGAGAVDERVAGSTTNTPAYPGGLTSSSIMILGVTTTTSTLPTVPGGWTQIYRSSPGGNTNPPTGMVCIKQATGSESGTLSVTTAASQSWGQILAFGGVETLGRRSGTMGYLLGHGTGTTGTVTITWSGTARNVGVLVSLRPSTSVVNPGQFFAMM